MCIKLEIKVITKRNNVKNFNISLKYHKVFTLEIILRQFLQHQNQEYYIINSVNLVANQINVQL